MYATDAQIDNRVRVVDVFPDNTHMPIVYPIALTAAAKADAIKFIDYVRGPASEETGLAFLPVRPPAGSRFLAAAHHDLAIDDFYGVRRDPTFGIEG